MTQGMAKDEIFLAGAREPLLVKYVTQCLRNRADDSDYSTVRDYYRNISKVLHAVNLQVGRHVGMIELCDIKEYYPLLRYMGRGVISTPVLTTRRFPCKLTDN